MRKGFGFYSTHETAIFFLKTMLVSFWIGVDLIAALVISTFPATVRSQFNKIACSRDRRRQAKTGCRSGFGLPSLFGTASAQLPLTV